MIRLHQYPAAWGLTSLSPFCIKVENYLRLRGIPYETVEEINPRRGPKHKMPFIEDGGTIVPDSGFILRFLMEKYGAGSDAELTPAVRAEALAFTRLVEESLYWVILYSRWNDPEGWNAILRDFAPLFPLKSGRLVLRLIRRELLAQARKQGSGRHSREEIYSIGTENIDSLAYYLGDKPFFTGAYVVSYDAGFHAFLQTILRAPYRTPLRDALARHANLIAYTKTLTRKLALQILPAL